MSSRLVISVLFFALLQMVHNEDATGFTIGNEVGSAATISQDPSKTSMQNVGSKVKDSVQTARNNIKKQIEDIMGRIYFIRESEISANQFKLAEGVKTEIDSLEQLLVNQKNLFEGNECLKNFGTHYSETITKAGNDYFDSCVESYPPGGSLRMDISDVTDSFDHIEKETLSKADKCNSLGEENGINDCLENTVTDFKRELRVMKQSKIKHMKAEAYEAEILERFKIDTCMKEALTSARMSRNDFKDQVFNCVSTPIQTNPESSGAVPRML